jgi:hypothetical protein
MLALLLHPSESALGTTVLQTSLAEMLAHSELVFEGYVVGVESKADPGGRLVYTHVTFALLDLIKGNWPEPTIELRFLGGTSGGKTLSIADMRIPKPGERGIYFVETPGRPQVNPLYGWQQGHLRLIQGDGGRMRVITADGRAVIGIDTAARRLDRALSTGAAHGLVIDPSAPRESSIAADAFKEALRRLLGESRP